MVQSVFLCELDNYGNFSWDLNILKHELSCGVNLINLFLTTKSVRMFIYHINCIQVAIIAVFGESIKRINVVKYKVWINEFRVQRVSNYPGDFRTYQCGWCSQITLDKFPAVWPIHLFPWDYVNGYTQNGAPKLVP